MLAPSLCASKQKKTKWFDGSKEHRTHSTERENQTFRCVSQIQCHGEMVSSKLLKCPNSERVLGLLALKQETRMLFTFNAMLPAKESRSSRSIPMRIEFQGSRYCSRSTASDEKPYITLVRLCSGVRCCSNLDCAAAGPSRGGETFRTLRTKLDLTCHRASVTGER
jgi:hypothetical protein